MPGPLLALTISSVAAYGFWAGPALLAGHGIAELATVVALTRGLGKVVKRPAVLGVIGLVGGAFLLWMGYSLITSFFRPPEVSPQAAAAGGFGIQTVLAGIAVSATNPYWILWWATMGTTYVAWSMQRRRTLGPSVFFAGHTLSDALWYTAVSIAVAGGSRLVRPQVYRFLLLACGIALVGLAVYFVVSGIRYLRGLRPAGVRPPPAQDGTPGNLTRCGPR